MHEYIGYVALTWLAHLGLPPALCVVLVVAGVLALSYAVHVWLERPVSPMVRRAVAGGGAGAGARA
jgi:hypothetical protein